MKPLVTKDTTKQSTLHSIDVVIKGKVYRVTILEDGQIQFSNCTCGSNDLCEHFYTALSGKTKGINEGGIASQKLLIASLRETVEGKRLLFKAIPIAKRTQSSWLRNKIRVGKEKLIWSLMGWLVNEELD